MSAIGSNPPVSIHVKSTAAPLPENVTYTTPGGQQGFMSVGKIETVKEGGLFGKQVKVFTLNMMDNKGSYTLRVEANQGNIETDEIKKLKKDKESLEKDLEKTKPFSKERSDIKNKIETINSDIELKEITTIQEMVKNSFANNATAHEYAEFYKAMAGINTSELSNRVDNKIIRQFNYNGAILILEFEYDNKKDRKKLNDEISAIRQTNQIMTEEQVTKLKELAKKKGGKEVTLETQEGSRKRVEKEAAVKAAKELTGKDVLNEDEAAAEALSFCQAQVTGSQEAFKKINDMNSNAGETNASYYTRMNEANAANKNNESNLSYLTRMSKINDNAELKAELGRVDKILSALDNTSQTYKDLKAAFDSLKGEIQKVQEAAAEKLKKIELAKAAADEEALLSELNKTHEELTKYNEELGGFTEIFVDQRKDLDITQKTRINKIYNEMQTTTKFAELESKMKNIKNPELNKKFEDVIDLKGQINEKLEELPHVSG